MFITEKAVDRVYLAACFLILAIVFAFGEYEVGGFKIASFICAGIGFCIFISAIHLQYREIAYEDWKAGQDEDRDQD